MRVPEPGSMVPRAGVRAGAGDMPSIPLDAARKRSQQVRQAESTGATSGVNRCAAHPIRLMFPGVCAFCPISPIHPKRGERRAPGGAQR